MARIIPASSTIIPTVELSPFIDDGDDASRKMVVDTIVEAIRNIGVFQIKIHGDDALNQCEKILELTRKFFNYSDEVKKECYDDLSGAGYGKYSGSKYYDFEYLLMYSPDKPYNGVPTVDPEYRKAFEDVFNYLVKTSQLLEEITNDGLRLPPNVLKSHNTDRCWDFMMPMHYTPSEDTDDIGIVEHLDSNFFTIILQDDDHTGLEFFKDGEWIPLYPKKGTLVVIGGDLIQVLSNTRIKNVTHRALKAKNGKRLAIDFVYNYGPDNWVEPLPELTTKIGARRRYKGFTFKKYVDLIQQNYENPPSNVEDFNKISIFEI